MDSRHMLPLMLPTDPRLLAVLPRISKKLGYVRSVATPTTEASSQVGERHNRQWKSRYRRFRAVDVNTLNQLDGAGSVSRWTKPVIDQEDEKEDPGDAEDSVATDDTPRVNTDITPLTKKPSTRRGRQSQGVGEGESTPV